MIKSNHKIKSGRLDTHKSKSATIDIGYSIKPIFTELCISCKNKNLLWNAPECSGCTDNQLNPGTMRKFKKIYLEYHNKKR